MANNHEQFIAFDDVVALTRTKKDELKKNRRALRDVIKNYFRDNKPNEIMPQFSSQGSFMMNTTVNPIPEETEDGEVLYGYDIDDGVYFIGEEDEDERKNIHTYHDWIYDAVKNHTDKGAVKKNTCVRVLYADGHHIDLPIYYKYEKGYDIRIPELAHKSKGWIDSDPREFYRWFNKEVDYHGLQLRRIVRYLKAWIDYRNSINSDIQMPSGFIMTILATENYSANERDDRSLYYTLQNIQNKIDEDHFGTFVCLRPTTPAGENLFAGFSDTRKKYFLKQLDNFIVSAKLAIDGKNQKTSCLKWQKHFGDRFSCSTAKDEDERSGAKSYESAAVITSNATSAK